MYIVCFNDNVVLSNEYSITIVRWPGSIHRTHLYTSFGMSDMWVWLVHGPHMYCFLPVLVFLRYSVSVLGILCKNWLLRIELGSS